MMRNVRLGSLLREARRSAGLTLEDVQQATQGTVKASMLSAYERGIRRVSDARLAVLAAVYETSVSALIDQLRTQPENEDSGAPVIIDVRALQQTDEVDLRRLVDQIVRWRGIPEPVNGLTIRTGDLRSIGAEDLEATIVRLSDAGLLLDSEEHGGDLRLH